MKPFALIFVSFLFFSVGYAQSKKDSTKASISKKALEEGIHLITRANQDSVLLENSYQQFLPYTGKIIRNIYVQSIGFEKSIYGTEKPMTQKIGRTANKLHTNTREKTIRQNLFIKPNEKLNPYKLADNERFFRDQEFILDSRFVITPIEQTDSVDITLITRDVFSIGFTVGGSIPTAPRFKLYDANLDGRGQRVELTMLYDIDRTPKTGFGASFKKTSFLGSFADLEIFYSELNTGISFGDEKEYTTGVSLNRKLVSPYSRIAGGIHWSKNWSKNLYSRPDSLFLDYTYTLADFWIGYNFGVKKKIQDRNRSFLGVRAFDGYFSNTPDQEDFFRSKSYNNTSGILTALTFYKTDFLKTQYVYGFGRTEDVPYGYSVTSTLGYVRRLNVSRPYAAIHLNFKDAFKSGDFYSIDLNTSSYFRNSKLEDAVIYASLSYYTKAFTLGNYKIRNAINYSFTKLNNIFANEYLQIYSLIIPGLRVRELEAEQRNSLRIESAVYTPWSLIGFRIAPFASLNLANLKCSNCEQTNNNYLGISTGLRIRNENLIFGTIELRGTYIPEDETGSSKFSFKLRQNLRIKKTDSFVTAPSFNRYNF